MTQTLPDRAQVVIVGGGVAGASLAYHLTKLGLVDVVVLERGVLTCGTTWHAAGLVMQLRTSHSLTALARYNVELYASLEAETGQDPGFKRNGTLGVARTAERVYETRRLASIARSFGIEAHLLSPAEARDLYPPLDADRVKEAIWIPQDGQINPVDTTVALMAGARQRGARLIERCPVNDMTPLAGGGYRVLTPAGTVECESLVLCAGLWTRELAALLGARVPLYPCEHMYVVTEPLDCVTPGLPVLRDTDGYVYVKEDAGKWLVGAFEPEGKPLPMDRLPVNSEFIELPEDWDHFELPFTKAMEILPPLADAGITKFMNGPESFTPDLLFALGEFPGLSRCYVAAGFNSEGVEFAPGAGRALAEWIVAGEPSVDLSEVDVARFHPFQTNRRYLHHRAGESLGLHYKMHWPYQQREASRAVRRSPFHDRLAAENACFGEANGWERPLWYAPAGVEPRNVYAHRRPNWFPCTGEECRSVRENVAYFDQTSFGKHLVQGRDACTALQRLCAGDVDVPPGKIVYTHMLNRRGGIETDVTVNRLDEQRFLIVSSATTHMRDKAWIERHLATHQHPTLADVTGAYAVLSLQGPHSRELLSDLTDADLSRDAFPFATSQEIDIAYARVIVNRLTYVGELGFELYIPTEFALSVYDAITATGRHFGLRPAGYHALEHLRLERAYREYGLDLTPEDTPFEAGLGFTVAMDKPGGFAGMQALEAQHGRLLTKRLVQFRLKDAEPVLFKDEPIWMDGVIVGFITSGAYAYTLGSCVGMGYVRHSDGVTRDLIAGARFEIEIAAERFPAEASLRPFYDPTGEHARM